MGSPRSNSFRTFIRSSQEKTAVQVILDLSNLFSSMGASNQDTLSKSVECILSCLPSFSPESVAMAQERGVKTFNAWAKEMEELAVKVEVSRGKG